MAVMETVPGDRSVCLTFDDGPNPIDTPRLLAVLRRNEVRAVFFLLGQFARKYPDIVQAIAADGHALGNHGMHHDDLTDWPENRMETDLCEATEAIVAAAPDSPVSYYRAPYGLWGRSPAVAAALGLRPVGWRLAIGDWQPPGTDILIERITTGVTPGAIVLLHDGGGDRHQTVEAVDAAIPLLRAEGWEFALPARPLTE